MSSINNKSKSFMLYKEWEEIFLALESDAERGELIREIFAFTRTGEDPDLKGAMKIAFMVMSNQLRRDAERYKKVCDRNQKNIAKRWDSEDDTKKYDRIPTDTKNTDKEKDKEKEKDEEKDEDEETELSISQETPAPSSPPAPEKNRYGEFNNISLSREEYLRLVNRFGKDMTDSCIESMDAYIEQSGREYRSCYAKLKNWISEESVKKRTSTAPKVSSAESGKISEQELADYESYARAHSMEDFARELEQRSAAHPPAKQSFLPHI